MDQNKENNILVIGGPNAGKTHFGGQLYGRLIDRSGYYKIITPPKDLTVFKEVLDRLNEGKSAGHTPVSANTRLELNLEDAENNKVNFSFPDYGGEQVQKIVTNRKLTGAWTSDIENCDSWMLFLRLDEIDLLEDVINRGIPDPKILKSRNKGEIPFVLSAHGYFVELLQILLHVKGISMRQRINRPQLTIVLSCWDNYEAEEKKLTPAALLEIRMPLLYNFICSTWSESSFSIIGLSSTGKTLSSTVADKEYVKKGPEAFGYFVTKEGKEEPDLTLTIAKAIGK
jgi:GTPase SAR1 family protein